MGTESRPAYMGTESRPAYMGTESRPAYMGTESRPALEIIWLLIHTHRAVMLAKSSHEDFIHFYQTFASLLLHRDNNSCKTLVQFSLT